MAFQRLLGAVEESYSVRPQRVLWWLVSGQQRLAVQIVHAYFLACFGCCCPVGDENAILGSQCSLDVW